MKGLDNISNSFDSLGEGVKIIANEAQNSTEEFHEKFISKVTPNMGKYGDAARFAAEMVPGVSEYNSLREGDWIGFAVSAGIDVGAIALGGISAGTGYALIKGGTSVGKKGVKLASKEFVESETKSVLGEGSKKIVKETYRKVKYSDEIAEFAKFPPNQLHILESEKLEETLINGRRVLKQTDLELDKTSVRIKDGVSVQETNLERIRDGRSPIGKDGMPIELHHIGQKMNSPLAEIEHSVHKNNFSDLHAEKGPTNIDRREFRKERSAHWRARAEEIEKGGE